MKPIALLLLLSAGIPDVICWPDFIDCSNRSKLIPYSHICDHRNDCPDASDEDPELCAVWRNTGGHKNYVEFCSSEAPSWEGTPDMRVCSMIKAGRIHRLPETTTVESTVKPETPSRPPRLYNLVEQDLLFFDIGHMNWEQARAFCGELNSDLLTIKNISHFAEIVRHLQTNELASDFWIGGSIANATVGWTWLDGSPMEMGTPYWATRYSRTCIQRNVTTATSETTCDHYYQAPEQGTRGKCASLSFEHSFYMTDEDCLRRMSPICVRESHSVTGPWFSNQRA
ncbi:uncharacterized protein [Palaemon carinicauda]